MAKVTIVAERPLPPGPGAGANAVAAAERLEITVRLAPDGRIDRGADAGDPWPVAWIGQDGVAGDGEIVRTATGWAVRHRAGDDHPLWRLETGVLRPGESVTLCDPDGGQSEYRIVAVDQD